MQSDVLESEVNNLLEAFSDLNNEELKELLDGDPAKLNAKLDELVNNSSMVSWSVTTKKWLTVRLMTLELHNSLVHSFYMSI